MKKFTTTPKLLIAKILCVSLMMSYTAQTTFAMQNHVLTTTTTESYSASSAVGRFENSTTNGAVAPMYNIYPNYPANN